MNDRQLLRYSRHILLDAIDIAGQERLLAARVLIVGAGGLGAPAAMYLAAAGVGRLLLVDDDKVELTNLQRQIIHRHSSLGTLKVHSASNTLHELNDEIDVQTFAQRADSQLLDALLPDLSLVLDCTDNFATRHLINAACVRHRVPLVSGAAIGFDGQVAVFDPRDGVHPCYACLFPPDQTPDEVSCASMGVLAPLTGVIGSMQAIEAIKVLAGVGKTLSGRLLLFNALTMDTDTIGIQRNPCCPVCGNAAAVAATQKVPTPYPPAQL